jgi:hypothetical protein
MSLIECLEQKHVSWRERTMNSLDSCHQGLDRLSSSHLIICTWSCLSHFSFSEVNLSTGSTDRLKLPPVYRGSSNYRRYTGGKPPVHWTTAVYRWSYKKVCAMGSRIQHREEADNEERYHTDLPCVPKILSINNFV